jgi:hypothetical protein
MEKFVPVPGPFGGIDEQATTDKFVEYVGGVMRATHLEQIRSMQHGKNKDEKFRKAAKESGFQDEEIDALLSL